MSSTRTNSLAVSGEISPKANSAEDQARELVDTAHPKRVDPERRKSGLIINADDWGRDRKTTDSIHDCVACGSVSATSAMVFMEDSERAASMARECRIDVGLHLNFTTPFSSANCSPRLLDHQGRVANYLTKSRFAAMIYRQRLSDSFDYLVRAQLDEFSRLYNRNATRIDGHHHMHLCANVLYGNLLPARTQVRRNFSFRRGEKNFFNRMYRRLVDRRLDRRHHSVDFFYSLKPIKPSVRLQHIFSTAKQSLVELETHPVESDEYFFLTGGELQRQAGEALISTGFAGLM